MIRVNNIIRRFKENRNVYKRHHQSYFEQLLFEASNQDFLFFVIRYLSQNPDNWHDEWVYEGCYRQRAQCVCGKEGLETVFIIRNTVTNVVLSPIGSVCIRKFNKNIATQISTKGLNFELLDVLSRGNKYTEQKLAMTQKFISKEDIDKFKNAGVINSDEKKACLKALNKRSATVADFDIGTDILLDKIVPAIRISLEEAVRTTTAEENCVYFDKRTRNYFHRLYQISNETASAADLEAMFRDALDDISSMQNESLNKTKRRLYNETKVVDSIHRNFYEARLVKKKGRSFVVLENRRFYNEDLEVEDYAQIPLEIEIFEIQDKASTLDDVLTEEDFENDFSNLKKPDVYTKIDTMDDVDNLYQDIDTVVDNETQINLI